MRKSWRSLFAGLGFLAAVIGQPALAADDCHRLAGFYLDLVPTGDGYLVPISLNGTPHFFLLKMNDAVMKIDVKLVDALQLATQSAPRGMPLMDGKIPLKQIATIPTLQIGPVPRKNTQAFTEERASAWGPRADGVVGMNAFSGFDIELDLAHNKLGLFLPRNCPFTPYWPYAVFGSANYTIGPSGAITIPMKLDGTDANVSPATSSPDSLMPFDSARALFKIQRDDPRLIAAGKQDDGSDRFRYPFKALAADNLTISNPQIYLYRSSGPPCPGMGGHMRPPGPPRGGPPRPGGPPLPGGFCTDTNAVTLGIRELRQLHFYFAFKDQKVYFTPAEPAPTAPPSVLGPQSPGSGAPH